MLFCSYTFVFAFLPVVLLINFGLAKYAGRLVQHIFLIAASLFFYGWFNPYYLVIIIFSIIYNYNTAMIMQKCGRPVSRQIVLAIGLTGNVLLLGYFKYYDFFIDNLNYLLATNYGLKHILLPLGISFFTFQQISFLVSNYKKPQQVNNFIDYSLFVCFFPQLIAGPIVTYDEMIPQFLNDEKRQYNGANFTAGLYLFAIGLCKKLVIADTVGLVADAGFDSVIKLSVFQAWFTSLSYSLQIYFDFSAYCDMATGLAKMHNINLPVNFNSPYKSAGIREFWRRWHITLSRALTNFIYIPMGGSHAGNSRMYFALFTSFFISGLWHGAAWTFVIWGILHGLLIIAERIFHDVWVKRSRILRVALVFLTVNFLWIFFRAKSWQRATEILTSHFGSDISLSVSLLLPFAGNSRSELLIILPIFVLALVIVFFVRNAIVYCNEFRPSPFSAFVTVAMLVVSALFMSRLSPFIYYNF